MKTIVTSEYSVDFWGQKYQGDISLTWDTELNIVSLICNGKANGVTICKDSKMAKNLMENTIEDIKNMVNGMFDCDPYMEVNTSVYRNVVDIE